MKTPTSSRDVLSRNVRELMTCRWGGVNKSRLRQEAARAGVALGMSLLSEVEAGTRSVGVDALDKLALALGVKAHELLDPALDVRHVASRAARPSGEPGTRRVLWRNVAALMRSHGMPAKASLREEAARRGLTLGMSVLTEMERGTRSVGIDLVDTLAAVLQVSAHALLDPQFVAPPAGTARMRQPSAKDGWPFRTVSPAELAQLTPEQLAYVEGSLMQALCQCKAFAAPARVAQGRGRPDS